MKRKGRYFVIFVMMTLVISSFPVFALDTSVSKWAEAEVQEAVDNNLVPKPLMKHYDQAITRYQYVLLALKVFEKSGQGVQMVKEHPFPDVFGLDYEEEIAKAYNAGIIKGYSDGTFKPENLITRQEIASLVVNLLLAMDGSREIQTDGKTQYGDTESISPWAETYIDYCYANDILKGVGKNKNNQDMIQPKGQATIEQAIVLLYRLAQKEELIIQDLGTVNVTQSNEDGEEESIQMQIINDFAGAFGKPLALAIQQLTEQEDILLTDMREDSAFITLKEIGVINIVTYDQAIEIYGNTSDIESALFKKTFVFLVKAVNDEVSIENLFNEAVSGFKKEQQYEMKKDLGSNNYFNAFSGISEDATVNDDENVRYTFNYKNNVIH